VNDPLPLRLGSNWNDNQGASLRAFHRQVLSVVVTATVAFEVSAPNTVLSGESVTAHPGFCTSA